MHHEHAASSPDRPDRPEATGPGRPDRVSSVWQGVNPHVLTGGLLHSQPTSKAIDWATLTVPESTAGHLRLATRFVEAATAQPGFGRSELREHMGGQVYRRWEPHQSSRAFGKGYESWLCSGRNKPGQFMRAVAGHKFQASRLDPAFDFECDEDAKPEDLRDAFRQHCDDRGITLGITGQADVNTIYVGAMSSERRLRIYRKDLQDSAIREFCGPTMRIEVQARKRAARILGESYNRSEDEFFAVATGMVFQLTGMQLGPMADVPEFVKPDGSDEAQAVFAFIQQHGDRVAALCESGVPLVELCQEHAARPNRSRMSKSRDVKLRRVLRSVGAGHLADLIRFLMHGAREVAA